MSVDSRKKLTAFYDSGKVVVTSEFVNSMFGGLHGTSEGDIIASVNPNDPRIIGHLHDGTHADGHAGKIDLVDHVKNELGHLNLANGAVRKRNIQCYPEELKNNAIPEFEIDPDTGEKCYYLNIDIPAPEGGGEPTDPAGDDTEIQFNDNGEFGSQSGYVFKKEDVDGLRNGKMGINIQSMKQNEPFALSVYGDEQIYSDEHLAARNDTDIDKNFKFIYGGFLKDSAHNDNVLEFRASHEVGRQQERYSEWLSENNEFALNHINFWKNDLIVKFQDLQAENGAEYLFNTLDEIGPYEGFEGASKHPRYNDGPNYFLGDFIVNAEPEVFVINQDEEFLDSLERFLSYWGEYYDEVVRFFGINENNREVSAAIELYGAVIGGVGDETISGPEERARYFLDEYESAYELLYRSLKISKDIKERLEFIDENDAAYGTAYKRVKRHSGHPEPNPNRWYKYSYTISDVSGSPEVYLSNSMDFYPWGANGNEAPNEFDPESELFTGSVNKAIFKPLAEESFIPNIDVPLNASVGNHFVYFRSRKNLYHTTGLEPILSIEVKPNLSSDSIVISDHKLEELVDGDLHVFGLITGGGEKGISIRQDEKGDPRVGINLNRDEIPRAELHIRGDSGRYESENPLYTNTPVVIEDVPSCSAEREDGTISFRPSIRGTLVINDTGEIYVNENIKCESASGEAFSLEGEPGEFIFIGSEGLPQSNRAIAIDRFRLSNPTVTMVDSFNGNFFHSDSDGESDPDANPMSFSSFEFSSAETFDGIEETSLLAKVTASRDNLTLIGSSIDFGGSSSPSAFIPPSGMINIGTTSFGIYENRLRVDNTGRVTLGRVDSLDASSSVNAFSSGIIAGVRYRINDNPDDADFSIFGAERSFIGTTFISKITAIPGSDILTGFENARLDKFSPRHAMRTLHVIGVDDGSPPVRIEDITSGDSEAKWGRSLMVNSDGDIYKNVGGAQFMEATAGEDLSINTPVSFAGFDSSTGRIIVKTDGNGSLATSEPWFSVDNDNFVGMTAGTALSGEVILIQNYGLFTSANIMISQHFTMWDSSSQTIPAGTPLKTLTTSQWQSLGPSWASFSETKWLTLDITISTSLGVILGRAESPQQKQQNRVGFLAEDWTIFPYSGQDISPIESIYQLENAKIYIRPGY